MVCGRLLGIGIDELRGGLFRHPRRHSRARDLSDDWRVDGLIHAERYRSEPLYYGLYLLSPEWFAPATLILCAVMSSATGTSWGTVATLGVALSGTGTGLWPLARAHRGRSHRWRKLR